MTNKSPTTLKRIAEEAFDMSFDDQPPTPNSTTDLDPDVAAWRDAFVSANGRQPDVLPQYERGWFVWNHRFGKWLTGRHRRADLREMTKRLLERANHG